MAIKVIERFPLTEGGWAPAWTSLVDRDAACAQALLEELARKAAARDARPFDRGKVAVASIVGTESWSDYGNVVLQMAFPDTLLSIEQKLNTCCMPS